MLTFDTTASQCAIGLFNDGKIVQKFYQKLSIGQAELLIPEISNILTAQKIKMNDIKIIACTTGPGSFTGVRASISAIKALGLALPKTTIIGINCFEAYLNMFDEEKLAKKNLVIIETKRLDFYYQIFDENKKAITEPATADTAKIIEQLKNCQVSIIGDGVERFLSTPSGLSFKQISLQDNIDVAAIAKIALQKFEDKKTTYPAPLYIKAPDACCQN